MMKLISRLFKDGHSCNICPFLILTIILLVISRLIQPVYGVQIIYEGEVIKAFQANVNSEIYIDYTHSVVKTNVRDVFILKEDKKFLLIRTEYDSFGAGLPTESFGTLKHEDGLYINEGINIELTEIPLRLGSIANHRLTLQDKNEIVFSEFLEPGNLVIIKPFRMMRLKVLRTL